MTSLEAAPPAADARPAWRWATFALVAALLLPIEISPEMHEGFEQELDVMAKGYETGTPRRQLALLALGAVGALLLVRGRGASRLRPRGALGVLLVAYGTLSLLSLAWADVPLLTARRLAAFGLMATAVVALVRITTLEDLARFALLASGGYLVVALVAELATGAFRPWADGYRFAGVFHPNGTGMLCGLFALAALSLGREGARFGSVAAALAAVVLLVATRSRTALGATAVALTARAIVAARPSRLAFAAALAGWLGCAAYLVAGDEVARSAAGAFLMSRADSDVGTLSGRTDLWRELLRLGAERPLLGHGFGGFWSAPHVEQVSASQDWSVGIGHSTYVDQFLELGVAGLGLWVLALAAGMWRSAARLRTSGGRGEAFALALLIVAALAGVLETVVPYPSLVTFLVFWALAALGLREPDAGAEGRA